MPGAAGFDALLTRFEPLALPTVRAIVRLEVARVADSCGYGVPLMDFRAPRRDGAAWLAKSSDQTLRRYLVANNQRSLDGLPAMSADELEGVVIRRDR